MPAWKLRRYFDLRNFYEPLKNLSWIVFWMYYIKKYHIDIVFSKWWYVAVPLCIAAFFLKKEIYIHESDTVSGIANKFIWLLATKVFYTFPHHKALIAFLILAGLSACNKPTYPTGKIEESVLKLCKDEYKLDDVQINIF